MSNLMLLSAFMDGEIDFSKTYLSKPIYQIWSARISISISKKQYPLIHFRDATSDTMHIVIPFCDHSTAPFASPKRGLSL